MSKSAHGLTLDIYARVSRLGDDRQRSTEGQVEDCTGIVTERGAEVGEVHIDSGRSAWNPRVRRPDWERLMVRLETGATDGVVVFDMARFSRRPIEGERLILAAERGLLVLDSEGEYDLTTANGRKTFRDQLNNAAYESDRLSTRTKRGKRLKASRGEPNVSRRPFGFEQDGVTIRESEAKVLRDIAERVVSGESQDDIVVELNRRGVATSTGAAWTRTSLKQLLLRPRNAGHIEHNGAIVSRLPGDPLLTSDTWERLNSLYASRRRGRPATDAYLCSGIVYCGRCGHRLTGRPAAGKKPYPDGTVRREYWCQPRAYRGGCGHLTVGQRELDHEVADMALTILADPRHAEAIESAAKETQDKRRPLEAELSECEHLANELSERLGRNEIKLSRYDAAMAPLDRRIGELQDELAKLDTKPLPVADPAAMAASREEWEARWQAATIDERRALIRQALQGKRVVIAPADRHGPRRFDPRRVGIADDDRP